MKKNDTNKSELTRMQKAQLTRFGEISKEEIVAAAKALFAVSGMLKECVEAMDNANIEKVVVDGVTKKQRSIDEIKVFTSNLIQAITQARLNQTEGTT